MHKFQEKKLDQKKKKKKRNLKKDNLNRIDYLSNRYGKTILFDPKDYIDNVRFSFNNIVINNKYHGYEDFLTFRDGYDKIILGYIKCEIHETLPRKGKLIKPWWVSYRRLELILTKKNRNAWKKEKKEEEKRVFKYLLRDASDRRQVFKLYINESYSTLACNVHDIYDKPITQFQAMRSHHFEKSVLDFIDERKEEIPKFIFIVYFKVLESYKYRVISRWFEAIMKNVRYEEIADVSYVFFKRNKSAHNGLRKKKKKRK